MTGWMRTIGAGAVMLALAGCGDDGAGASTDSEGDATGTTDAPTGGTAGEATGGTTGAAEALTAAELAGTWASKACESYPDGMGGESHLRRTFVLTETTWHLELAVFAEATCDTPLFLAEVDGPYSMRGLSSEVAGATEGDFGIEKITFTARSEAMVGAFTGAGCGTMQWAVDVPQDVSSTGCLITKATADCPQEHDIAAIVGGELRFGERITDLCDPTGRPKALDSHALAEQ